ncbi:cyclase family protein [Actinacidiphila alni]|uniref:cyclase family protein n=1 Tax=Actinacidiphila alni TaxID=380248 RepID=UPI003403BCB7
MKTDNDGDEQMRSPRRPLTNRGRWGADDDRGTLNFITAAVRARAVAEATTGRVVSTVTAEDLTAAEKRQAVRVESGDALVVRTGWTGADDPFGPLPTTSLSAVEWMADREVALYAGDTGDKLPEPTAAPPVLHEVALAQLGMPLIDCVNVTALARFCAETGRYSFLFVLGTIPLRGATGLPANPLAIF